MKRFSWKKLLSWLLKAGLSLLALYLVFRKIDMPQLLVFKYTIDWKWLIPAFIFFNLSKLLSAVRLNMLFENAGLRLNHTKNILLYYIGMFYNLFLPGGIGGDGYKVYILKKYYSMPVKPFVSAVFYDRLNGVTSLGFIACLVAIPFFLSYKPYLLIAAISAFPVLFSITASIFRTFIPSFTRGNMYSIGVQLMQVVAVICILFALQLPEYMYLPYILLFLVSSIAAALPVSIGGVGAREMVFVYGTAYLATDAPTGVIISMLFFMITAISSFAGIFIPVKKVI